MSSAMSMQSMMGDVLENVKEQGACLLLLILVTGSPSFTLCRLHLINLVSKACSELKNISSLVPSLGRVQALVS